MRKHQAEKLLRMGLEPGEIAVRMGISFDSVIQYLLTRVGERALKLSDIYFSLPPDKRQALQKVIQNKQKTGRIGSLRAYSPRLTWNDVRLFESLRDRKVFAGDMYEYVSETEINLHNMVRTTLCGRLGDNEHGWWRLGIPANIREKCVSRRELDDDPSGSPFCYTDLIDLSNIITKNWSCFECVLPAHYAKDRKSLERDLRRLNNLRNTVMHPIKGRKWSEDDFLFVRSLQIAFNRKAD